jgi:hypothetical protein
MWFLGWVETGVLGLAAPAVKLSVAQQQQVCCTSQLALNYRQTDSLPQQQLHRSEHILRLEIWKMARAGFESESTQPPKPESCLTR